MFFLFSFELHFLLLTLNSHLIDSILHCASHFLFASSLTIIRARLRCCESISQWVVNTTSHTTGTYCNLSSTSSNAAKTYELAKVPLIGYKFFIAVWRLRRTPMVLFALLQKVLSGKILWCKICVAVGPNSRLIKAFTLKTVRQAGVYLVWLGLWMLSNAPRGRAWREPTAPSPTAPSPTLFKASARSLGAVGTGSALTDRDRRAVDYRSPAEAGVLPLFFRFFVQ